MLEAMAVSRLATLQPSASGAASVKAISASNSARARCIAGSSAATPWSSGTSSGSIGRT